eukprot:459508_1
MALRRITKELKDLESTGNEFQVAPQNDNLFEWKCYIQGPTQTPYEGGLFELQIKFPQDYPFKPPKMNFLTYIYHINVKAPGGVDLPILHDEWNPRLNINKCLLSVISMLQNPDFSNNSNRSAGKTYHQNRKLYMQNAVDFTQSCAIKKNPHKNS